MNIHCDVTIETLTFIVEDSVCLDELTERIWNDNQTTLAQEIFCTLMWEHWIPPENVGLPPGTLVIADMAIDDPDFDQEADIYYYPSGMVTDAIRELMDNGKVKLRVLDRQPEGSAPMPLSCYEVQRLEETGLWKTVTTGMPPQVCVYVHASHAINVYHSLMSMNPGSIYRIIRVIAQTNTGSDQ